MKFIKRLNSFRWRIITQIFYKHQLSSVGKNSLIINPFLIGGNINIGYNTIIRYKTWIQTQALTDDQNPTIIIGNNCSIGHYNEIYATKSIIIEDYVLTADRVYISDNSHGYTDINLPILYQPIKQLKSVRIGEGTWLGVGVAVIGATIGKHCVIGANAVVTRNIPDYCVAVGIPARIIKRYDFATNSWRKTHADGTFI